MRVLHVDDDSGDRELLRLAFENAAPALELEQAEDGAAALERLERPPRPDLVLLDVNMPGIGGFEVLEWIRGRRELTGLPVFVLSSSGEPRDVERAYEAGASSYFEKGTGFSPLLEVARGLQSYLRVTKVTSR